MNLNKIILAALVAMTGVTRTSRSQQEVLPNNNVISSLDITVTGGDVTQTEINKLIRDGKIRMPIHHGPVLADPEMRSKQNERQKQLREQWQNEAIEIIRRSKANVLLAKDSLSDLQQGEDVKIILNNLISTRFNDFITNPEDKEIISRGIGDLIKLNIEKIDINQPLPGMKGLTLLHVATLLNDQELIERLIERGANLNALDDKGYSAIKYSALEGNMHIAKILAFNGADTRDLERYNSSELLNRNFKEHDIRTEQAEYNYDLARAYSNAYQQEEYGHSMPHSPVTNTVKPPIINGPPPYSDPIRAIREDDIETLKAIIDNDRNILQHRDALERSLLDVAAFHQNKQAVELLLEQGIKPKLLLARSDQATRAAAYYFNQAGLSDEKEFKRTYDEILTKVKAKNEQNLLTPDIVREYREYKEHSQLLKQSEAIKTVRQVTSKIKSGGVKRGGVRSKSKPEISKINSQSR